MLLAAVVDLLQSSASANTEHSRTSRAELIRKLDELDPAVLEAGADGHQPFRTALAELVAALRAWRRVPVMADSIREMIEPGGEAIPSPPAFEGKMTGAAAGKDRDAELEATYRRVATSVGIKNALSQDQGDRVARELYRGLMQLQAAKSDRPRVKARAPNPYLGTLPTLSVNQGGRDVFLRQVNMAHQRLASRLETGLAATAKEVGMLRSAVCGAVKEIGAACGPLRNQQVAAALESEFAKLTQRLDTAGDGFASLAALERSISGISGPLEEIRQLVNSVSKAAEPGPGGSLLSHEAAQNLMLEIASLRDRHEETAKSAALSLTAIKESLEQVAGHCARLETAAQAGPLYRPGTGTDPSDPFVPIFTRLTQHCEERALAINARASGNGIARAGAAPGEIKPEAQGTCGPAKSAHDGLAGAAGFLIEPGLGFPGRAESDGTDGQVAPRVAGRESESAPSRTDFIAAARRAARAAQMELRGTAPASLPADTGRGERRSSLYDQGRDFLIMHKLPLFVAAAVLLIALGALVLARPLVHGRFIDLLPGFMSQFHGGARDGVSPRKVKAPDASYKTIENIHLSLAAPAGQPPSNRSEAGGLPPAPVPAAGTTQPAAAAIDPLAPPETPSSPAGAGSKPSPATRVITGSDAILAGTMQSAKPALPSSSVRRPVPASRLNPSAPLSGTQALPSAGGPIGPPASALPTAGLEKSLLASAEAGDAAAQYELAAAYAEDGAGTANLGLAAQWYEKAAQQGHAVAAYRLASLYERGHGVAKSIERAKALYQRASEQGNIRAMHNLGVLAAEGNDGKPNYTSAALWFGKAAEFGIRDSQYNLAVLLARGLGVTKDFVRSYTWFAIVAASGDEDAAKKRGEVAARLTSSELAAANAAAAAFVPRPADNMANEPAPPGQGAAPAYAQPVKPKISGL